MADCYWIQDSTPDGDTIWQTTCANTFMFMAEGPKANTFMYCPYCGGYLVTDQGDQLK